MTSCKKTAIQAVILTITLCVCQAALAQFHVSDDDDWCSEAFQRGVFGYANNGEELAVVDPKGDKEGDETSYAIRIVDAREPQHVIAMYKAVILKGGSDDSSYTNCNVESQGYKDFLAYWSARRYVTVRGEWTDAHRDGAVIAFPGGRELPLSKVLVGPDESIELCASHTRWGFYIVPLPNGHVVTWMEFANLDPNWSSKQRKASLPKCKYASSTLAPGWIVLADVSPPTTKISEKQMEQGLGVPTRTEGEKPILPQRCTLDELIVEPAPDSPDWVIMQTLQASLDASMGRDDNANFAKFFDQFAVGNDEGRIKTDYWGPAKQHVRKYLQGDGTNVVTFKICERRDEAAGLKIFIQSLDPKKVNPFYVLRKNERGAWKITLHPI